MTPVVRGSVSVWELVFLGLWVFAVKAASMDFTELEKIAGQAVRETLMLAGITEENAADLMHMDVSALRKCLRGEGKLQLGVARLMRLPFGFWLHFSPVLMYLVAKKHAQEIAESLGLRKSA